MHHVIYIPGLHDKLPINRLLAKLIPKIWNRYGVETHIFEPCWSEGTTFQPKLHLITQMIDKLEIGGNTVSLVGQSAGGAAALNAFTMRKSKVNRVISIDGRIRKGMNVFPSLDLAAVESPAFKDSVLLFEEMNMKKLTKEDRKRIMVIHPIWDEIVPISTAKLEGTIEITMPIFTHRLGGLMAGGIYAKKMMEFLRKTD